MGKIFITSDLHFCHQNIIEYCNRPFKNVDDMNKALIKKWNSVVGKDDTVIVLGDIGFGPIDKLSVLCKKLNGHKRLIMGNHDTRKPLVYTEMGFEWVSPFPVIMQNKYILSHYPMDNVPTGYINLYGHIHGNPIFPTFCKDGICVCCDRFDFKPQEFSTLISEYKKNYSKNDFLSYYTAISKLSEDEDNA